MKTTILSKNNLNGGRTFITYNDKTKYWHIGNTASTAVSYEQADITLWDVTVKQIKELANRLSNLGYKEYQVSWRDDVDTYGDIQERLLAR